MELYFLPPKKKKRLSIYNTKMFVVDTDDTIIIVSMLLIDNLVFELETDNRKSGSMFNS